MSNLFSFMKQSEKSGSTLAFSATVTDTKSGEKMSVRNDRDLIEMLIYRINYLKKKGDECVEHDTALNGLHIALFALQAKAQRVLKFVRAIDTLTDSQIKRLKEVLNWNGSEYLNSQIEIDVENYLGDAEMSKAIKEFQKLGFDYIGNSDIKAEDVSEVELDFSFKNILNSIEFALNPPKTAAPEPDFPTN